MEDWRTALFGSAGSPPSLPVALDVTAPAVARLFAAIPDAVPPTVPVPPMPVLAIPAEPATPAEPVLPPAHAIEIQTGGPAAAAAHDSAASSTPSVTPSRAPFHAPSPFDSTGRSSNPHPVPGTKLEGADVVYRPVLTKETESEERQMQVTPITLYQTEVTYQHGALIAVNNNYICYAIRGGHIRVINKNSGQRTLLKGHTAAVVDLKFYAPTVGRDGVLNVWRVFEAADDAIGHEVAFSAPASEDGGAGVRDIYRRLAWHPHNTLMFATAAAADATVWVWRAAAGGRAAQWGRGVLWDGRLAATACADGRVRVYEVEAHPGRGVTAVLFAGAHRYHAQQTGGGAAFAASRLMITGASNNAEFCVFECTGWTRVQRLVLEIGPPEAPLPFYNLAACDPSGSVLLVANTTQNALYALHVGSHGFDLATEFAVTQPIVSFCVACQYRPRATPAAPAGHAGHAATPPRGAVASELHIYCVQTKAIQQYHLRLEHCAPPPAHLSNASSGHGPHTPHGTPHGTPHALPPQAPHVGPSSPPSPAPLPGRGRPPTPPAPAASAGSPAPHPAAPASAVAVASAARGPPRAAPRTRRHRPAGGGGAAGEPREVPPKSASPLNVHRGAATAAAAAAGPAEPPSPSSSSALPPAPAAGAADVQRAVVKELRRLEEKLERVIVQQTEKHVARLEKERTERERAERERQERLLTAVSQTIHSTLPQQLEAIVGRSLQAMGPALRAETDAAVARAVAEATRGGGPLANAVLAGVAPKVERAVKDAVGAAAGQMAEDVAQRLSGAVKAAVQEGFKAQFGGTLVPAFEASCRRMFEQINATFDRGMDERIQKPFAEYFQNATANLSQASSALSGVAQTVTASALLGAAGAGPRETIARLAREERFEAAFNAALSAGDVELVAWLCALVPVDRVFAPGAPPLSQAVLVTLIQHLGFDLSRDTAAKLRWIQASCLALNPARQEAVVREVVPRVLGQLHAHLQAVQRSYVAAPGDLSAASTVSQLRMVTHLVHSLLSGQ
eukprot:tig00001038_g6536.t1